MKNRCRGQVFLSQNERKRIRLSGYDYSSDGYYFVTICTQNRENFFGNIKNAIMGLNNIGCIVAQCLQNIPQHFNNATLDVWVIMPNHIHGIVVINDTPKTTNVGDADLRPAPGQSQWDAPGQSQWDAPGQSQWDAPGQSQWDADLRPLHDPIHDSTKMLLPKIIHGFKSSVTRIINKLDPYTGFQWQRSYYDHIIRNNKSLNNIQDYIQNNPYKWELDIENKINQLSDLEIKKHYDALFI